MTVVSSASGTRIDCDVCGQHAAKPARSAHALRLEAGYVLHAGRDWCPGCWREHTADRLRTDRDPGRDRPAAP